MITAGAEKKAVTYQLELDEYGKTTIEQIEGIYAWNMDRILRSAAFDLESAFSEETAAAISRNNLLKGMTDRTVEEEKELKSLFPTVEIALADLGDSSEKRTKSSSCSKRRKNDKYSKNRVCCNVNYKGTKFSLYQVQIKKNGALEESLLDDVVDVSIQACFINATKENPTDFFVFEYAPDLEVALVRPKNGSLRANRMIKDLGLNEREGLLSRRTEVVEDMLEIIADLQEESLSEPAIARKKERFRKYVHPKTAFSVFAHSLAQEFQLDL